MPKIFTKEELGEDRVSGFYETPIATVQHMIELANIDTHDLTQKILDPCVGDGVFLEMLNEYGIKKDNLYGYDIDKIKVEKLWGKGFKNIEVLDATKPFNKIFDVIIGNPPYNGDESYFVRENRERLKKDFVEIGAKNTFSMITFNCVEHLKEGGSLVFILSDAFLTNTYYEKFRNFLIKKTQIKSITLAPRNLFRHIGADVGTAIISLKKNPKNYNPYKTKNQPIIELVDRLDSEEEYQNYKQKAEYEKQDKVLTHPKSTFIIGVPQYLKNLYLNAQIRLGDVLEGGTGISTGNDKRYLKKAEEISEGEVGLWVPYYKNGAREKFYYKPQFFIEKNYRQHSNVVSNYMIRNERYFFKEGITCSSVGIRFSASYMPSGGLFGVNANFFCEDRSILFYLLGLLNTDLAWYFARKVLIRTNNISSNYLKKFPVIFPQKEEFISIALLVEGHVQNMMNSRQVDEVAFLKELNGKFNKIYKIDSVCLSAIQEFVSNFYIRL